MPDALYSCKACGNIERFYRTDIDEVQTQWILAADGDHIERGAVEQLETREAGRCIQCLVCDAIVAGYEDEGELTCAACGFGIEVCTCSCGPWTKEEWTEGHEEE